VQPETASKAFPNAREPAVAGQPPYPDPYSLSKVIHQGRGPAGGAEGSDLNAITV
jgi:hypothetical protein